MKHFILFTTKGGFKLSLPIEDITRIDTFKCKGYTTIFIEENEYYVRDDIEEVVKRINQVVYGEER